MTPERVAAMPGKPGRAACTKCGHPNVPTRWERGVEKFEAHTIYGGELPCFTGSHRRVTRPAVRR